MGNISTSLQDVLEEFDKRMLILEQEEIEMDRIKTKLALTPLIILGYAAGIYYLGFATTMYILAADMFISAYFLSKQSKRSHL